MPSNMELMVQIAADANRFAAEMNRATGATDSFASGFRARFQSLNSTVAQFGLQLGGIALTLRSFKTSSGIESAMAGVESNFRKSTTTAKEWMDTQRDVKKTAFDVQKATASSYKEIIGITDAYLKAGVSMDAIKGSQGAAWAAASLSTVTGRDANEIGDDMARLGSSFGLKNDQYGWAADTLARGEAASPGALEEILYSLRQFSAGAKNLNVSFDDAVAAAAVATPLGGQAGSSINRFLGGSAGKTKLQRNAMVEAGLGTFDKKGRFKSKAFDDKGNFIGLDKWASIVRETMGGIENQQKRSILASQIWGQEGERFALLLANADQDKSFGAMKTEMREALSLQERMDIITGTFSASLTKAKNSLDLFGAKLSEPFLDRGTGVLQTVSNGADALTEWMGEEGNTEKLLGGGAAVALLWKGIQMWKRKKGVKNDAIDGFIGDTTGIGQGVITGKMLQSAAGVTPVYVVNMPDGGIGGAQTDGFLPGKVTPKPTKPTPKPSWGSRALGALGLGGLSGKALLGTVSAGVAPLAAMGGITAWAGKDSHKTELSYLLGVTDKLNGYLSRVGLDRDPRAKEREMYDRRIQDGLGGNSVPDWYLKERAANQGTGGMNDAQVAIALGTEAGSQIASQVDAVNQALVSTLKGTDIGGTISIKVLSPNVETQVMATPNQSSIKYNLGLLNGVPK